jgi:hypothetical protein
VGRAQPWTGTVEYLQRGHAVGGASALQHSAVLSRTDGGTEDSYGSFEVDTAYQAVILRLNHIYTICSTPPTKNPSKDANDLESEL